MPPLPGWSFPGSPFHPGEQQVQERLGVRERMEAAGRHVLRNAMPQQHRDFFAHLPFLVLGTVDDDGQPWASIAAGAPGFLSTPDERTLRVAAPPPLGAFLRDGGDIGALGIDFATRRRNRANGLVRAPGPAGFDIAVIQSFGNCPKYIQARDWSVSRCRRAGARRGAARALARRRRARARRRRRHFLHRQCARQRAGRAEPRRRRLPSRRPAGLRAHR